MSNIINLDKNYIFVGFRGETAYSSKIAYIGFICEKGKEEKLKTEFDIFWRDGGGYYFRELDGKHSEVEGEYIEVEDLKEILKIIHSKNFNGFIFEKAERNNILSNEEFEKYKKLNEEFFNIKNKTIQIFEIGEEKIKIQK